MILYFSRVFVCLSNLVTNSEINVFTVCSQTSLAK